MLELTPDAAARLARLLDRPNISDQTTFRFVLEGYDTTVKFDRVRPGDATFEHEGRTILVLDAQVAQRLADKTLDVQDNEGRARFMFC